MSIKYKFATLLILIVHVASWEIALAKVTINLKNDSILELKGVQGLKETSLFKGSIPAGGKYQIDTPYRGLALLVFEGGQSYPVLINDEPFTLKITTSPNEVPSIIGSEENDYFYKLLSGKEQETEQYPFANLMIQAKKLLESTHTIHTTNELFCKKNEIHNFIHSNYPNLKNSDMIRRLIAQYFMMHEYVNYHVEGAPATNIKKRYQQEILSGVRSWLETLKPHILEHEVLNYIVSLYYNRSMIALASLISNQYREFAYCPGVENGKFSFQANTTITQGNEASSTTMGEIKGRKLISFVSKKCPVSMVATVIKARQIASSKMDVSLIVVPLEKLSEKHFAMNRMVSGGKMFFIDDEKLPEKIKLPLLIDVKNGLHPKNLSIH